MKLVGQLIVLTFLLAAGIAHAETYCHDDDLVVDRHEIMHFAQPSHLQFRLPNNNTAHYFTFAALHFLTAPGADPAIYVDNLVPPSQNLGFEYMIYKIRVELGVPGTANFWSTEIDYTQNCVDSGLAVGPNDRTKIPLKLPHREGELMRIKIWGRHI